MVVVDAVDAVAEGLALPRVFCSMNDWASALLENDLYLAP